MGATDTHSMHSLMQAFVVCLLCFTAKVEGFNKNVSGFYVFGDSIIDPGNNDNLLTFYKANVPPYGMDRPDHIPTGRYSNGKLPTDFIASYIGVKTELLPAYKLIDPSNIQELMTGVSFASAGSGFDNSTSALGHVIGMQQQLDYFREVKKRLEDALGKEKSDDHIKKALFFVCAGTNDFALNYFQWLFPGVTPQAYEDLLLNNTKFFLQGLLAEGVTKVAIAGVPPLGCIPGMITFHSPISFPPVPRQCLDYYSSIAREYNQKLQTAVLQLNSSNADAKIYYIDIYKPLDDMITNPQQFGFDEVHLGCCGSGTFELGILCSWGSLLHMCPDRTKYLFFDSAHPTETAYYNIFLHSKPMIDFIIND